MLKSHLPTMNEFSEKNEFVPSTKIIERIYWNLKKNVRETDLEPLFQRLLQLGASYYGMTERSIYNYRIHVNGKSLHFLIILNQYNPHNVIISAHWDYSHEHYEFDDISSNYLRYISFFLKSLMKGTITIIKRSLPSKNKEKDERGVEKRVKSQYQHNRKIKRFQQPRISNPPFIEEGKVESPSTEESDSLNEQFNMAGKRKWPNNDTLDWMDEYMEEQNKIFRSEPLSVLNKEGLDTFEEIKKKEGFTEENLKDILFKQKRKIEKILLQIPEKRISCKIPDFEYNLFIQHSELLYEVLSFIKKTKEDELNPEQIVKFLQNHNQPSNSSLKYIGLDIQKSQIINLIIAILKKDVNDLPDNLKLMILLLKEARKYFNFLTFCLFARRLIFLSNKLGKSLRPIRMFKNMLRIIKEGKNYPIRDPQEMRFKLMLFLRITELPLFNTFDIAKKLYKERKRNWIDEGEFLRIMKILADAADLDNSEIIKKMTANKIQLRKL